ncbi:MAG: hypothetical protein VYA30_16165 [Myxococcota bacterium]|nr:hypothetical protein [Myxococcota bacterium]
MNAKIRPFLIWAGVSFLASVGLCFVPLFNLLAFEFAFAMSIPLTIAGGLLGVYFERWPSDWVSRLRVIGSLSILIWLAALAPILLNALRVQNCNLLEGLVLFLIFPVLGSVAAFLWGLASETLYSGKGMRLFIGIWTLFVFHGLYKFVVHPPVDIYSPLLGYWPGALYDDVFLIDQRLWVSRFEDLSIALLALTLVRHWTSRPHHGRKRWLTSLTMCAIFGFTHLAAVERGVHRDKAYIQSALGGHIETGNFNIYYPARWSDQRIVPLQYDLEFYYTELTHFFLREPTEKISVYFYTDPKQKKWLMGARRTRIAKPWQWSFHVDKPRLGLATIKHEMAHVFAAVYGRVPHRLSLTHKILPNMGIIEGIAEAATWPIRRLDLHQWSAAMHELKIAPEITRLLSPQKFYGLNSGTAYTLCGSFVRHVYETHGPDRVWNAYRDGEFAEGSLEKLSPLLNEWKARLAKMTVPRAALAQARNKFDRPSIFGRVCAREIASLWRIYRRERSQVEPRKALSTLNTILGHLPNNPSARLAQIDTLAQINELETARTLAAALATDHKAGGVARNLASERLVDLDVALGDLTNARSRYEQLSETVFSRPRLRELSVKAAALAHPDSTGLLMRYLRSQMKPKERLAQLQAIEVQTGQWPVLTYLMARARLALGQKQASAELFVRSSQTLKSVGLVYESRLQLAQLLFSSGCYQLASQAYDSLAQNRTLASLAAEQSELREWARRSRFFEKHMPNTIVTCPIKIDMDLFGAEYAGDTGF